MVIPGQRKNTDPATDLVGPICVSKNEVLAPFIDIGKYIFPEWAYIEFLLLINIMGETNYLCKLG